MIVRGPTPAAPVTPTTDWTVSLSIDMTAHTINVYCSAPGMPTIADSQTLPAPLLAALQAYAQGRAEFLLAWTAKTSALLVP